VPWRDRPVKPEGQERGRLAEKAGEPAGGLGGSVGRPKWLRARAPSVPARQRCWCRPAPATPRREDRRRARPRPRAHCGRRAAWLYGNPLRRAGWVHLCGAPVRSRPRTCSSSWTGWSRAARRASRGPIARTR